MTTPTYKQSVKDKSWRSIWEHAVVSLTSKRSASRMLDEAYLNKLSRFVESKSGWMMDSHEELNCQQYVNLSYGQKTPEQLKVAFFCGPEPENDVEVLLSLGVRLENMFAFEKKEEEFEKAVMALRGKYPQQRLFSFFL